MYKKLYRSRKNEMICGVCAGIADYFEIDVTLVRLIAVITGLFSVGIIAYLICALVIPVNPDENYHNNDYDHDEFDDKKPYANSNRNKKLMGFILIILGVFFLLEKFIGWLSFEMIVSIVLIIIGISFLTNIKRNSN
ncbi:PspC domain-containing protein [Abyssisolibacter fermentans]|uniref:PspC domain-containing protein n=1 Tax=Abyssisolibacter fermentans TaxID=1766203 RepID=UPI00082E5B97|nr:PspC domain-containing protein [Abyssisolibacter fermentans]